MKNFFFNDMNIPTLAKEYNELLNIDNDSIAFKNRIYDIKYKLNIYIKGTLERLNYSEEKMDNVNYQSVMKHQIKSGFSLEHETGKIYEMKKDCDSILDKVKLGIKLDDDDIINLEYLCLYNKMQKNQLYAVMLIMSILLFTWILLN